LIKAGRVGALSFGSIVGVVVVVVVVVFFDYLSVKAIGWLVGWLVFF